VTAPAPIPITMYRRPRRIGARRLVACFAIALAFVVTVSAKEAIPPAPAHYFNDYASALKPATAAQLDATLAQFERDTSNQIVVAIFPHMQSDSSIEDYTTRVYEAWKIGRQKLNNGAALFIFSQDHRMRIQTGYGLEGALPDALCKRILDDEIAPRLRAGDFDGGVSAGVQAMMAAARGEYRGTGRTTAESRGSGSSNSSAVFPLFFVIVFILIAISGIRQRLNRGVVYGRRGRLTNPWWWGGGGGSGWSGGGGSSWDGGGGGGFSGGGGSTGGGGASGSW
jgi:uncharacterized protein